MTAPSAVAAARPVSTPAERRAAELGVLVVMVLWAGNFIVVKGAIAVLPPVAFTFLRYALAALTLLLLLRWREGRMGLPRREILPIAVLGTIGFAIYQILWTAGLQSISAGDSALLIATTPVMTALIAAAIGADVLTPARLGGALLSFAGVALVIAGGPGLALSASLLGDVLTLLAAACWAIYTSFGVPILRRHSPLRTTAWSVTFGAIALAPLGLFQLAEVAPVPVDAAIVLAILYSATLAAGVANVVVFHGVKLLGPTRITAMQFLVPAIAVVLAAVILHEPIRLAQIVGGAVILAGVAIARTDRVPARVRAILRA
ncbi:MAG: DMT family transporter [Chloroflexota bacterium]